MASLTLTIEERGKFAEHLIMSLFLACQRKIFHNGSETTNPHFYARFQNRKKQGEHLAYNHRLRQILSKPDFIVENIYGDYDFAEVKLRSTHYHPPDADDAYFMTRAGLRRYFDASRELWKPEIILITTSPRKDVGMFSVISYPYYDEKNGNMYSKSLSDVKKWGINKSIIKLFEAIITEALQVPQTFLESQETEEFQE